MKARSFAVILAALSMLAVAHAISARAAEPVITRSPDGNVAFRLIPGDAQIRFEVTFRDKTVIAPSPLNMLLDGANLSSGAAIIKTASYHVQEHYPWHGVHTIAVNDANGTTLSLKSRAGLAFALEVRVANDSVAFRHVIPGAATASRIPDEATTFTLPAGAIAWVHGLRMHYEDTFQKTALAEVAPGQWAAPPLTLKLPGDAGYASITEAALRNYAGMALQADGRGGFGLKLGHAHPPSYPYTLRYGQAEATRLAQPATVAGTIVTPWRVVMIGRDLNTLVNCDALPNLCPPPDPALFPRGAATEWVKPGRAVWEYLDGGEKSLAGMRDFCRMAGELGFEYNVIEGFWRNWSPAELKGLADDARRQGVGLWLWKHSRDLRTPEQRREFFKTCREAGAVGVKLDFFDHEAKEVIDLYETLLREAAENHLLVNFHGSNKPTGLARTWPNELTREAVKGMESSKLKERALHDVTLPFTRLLAGYADYTPVHFGARRADTTWAHQLASGAILTSPLLTYAANPATMLKNPCLPMIKAIPAAWDETIVLPCSAIGEVAAFARRSGSDWFLAIMNGPTARSLKIPLAFLPAGRHKVMLIRDDQTTSAAVKIENASFSPADTLTIDLATGGGFIARFEPANQPVKESAAAAPATPRLLGISHVAFKVSDITKSRAFYCDFLGFAEQAQLNNRDGSLALAFIKVNDDQYLELFPGLQPGADRLYQVAFRVEGIEALRARLAEHGLKVPASVPRGRIGNTNFTTTDPDGHTIEFVQYEPDGWTRRDHGKFLPPTRISALIRHAGFLVTDVGAAQKFYGGLLGMKEAWRGSRDDKNISWITMQFPLGIEYVEFMLCTQMPPPDKRGTENHISLEVPDIEAAKAALDRNPHRKDYTRPIEIKTGKNHKRQLNLYDPDGTRVELMEPGTVDGRPAPSSAAPLPGE